MSDTSRQLYEKCLEQMMCAARRWISEHKGITFAVRLPPEDMAVIGPLDDSTIAMLALDADTIAFLKELERIGELHGGATIMQAIGVIRAIGHTFPVPSSRKAKAN